LINGKTVVFIKLFVRDRLSKTKVLVPIKLGPRLP